MTKEVNDMEQKPMLYGIIGLLGGILLTIVFTTNVVNSNNVGMMRMMGMHTSSNQMMDADDDDRGMMRNGPMMNNNQGMTMSGMVSNLKGKTGDDFDKLFLSEMIEHHQGAIDMAKLAQQNAGHEEVTSLANDIITAQTKEIQMMREWQKNWGY